MDGLPRHKVQERRDLAWEAAMIAEAVAEADAGLLIPSADIKKWIDSLGSANSLPLPSLRLAPADPCRPYHAARRGRKVLPPSGL